MNRTHAGRAMSFRKAYMKSDNKLFPKFPYTPQLKLATFHLAEAIDLVLFNIVKSSLQIAS